MNYSCEAANFTEEVMQRARRYGFDLVGIVSAKELDMVPSHFIGHRDYMCYTKKTVDYMGEAKSLIILGLRVWDNLFDMVIKVGDHHEYPDEWRGRLYSRRLARFLNSQGYETILEPDLLSKKRMAQLGGLGCFGKQTLIITPMYGPWVRLRSILTDAELVPTQPFTEDLCKDCEECLKACPVGALTPYKLDPDKCLLGMDWDTRFSDAYRDKYYRHNPSVTENAWLMCSACQRACPIGSNLRFKPLSEPRRLLSKSID